MSDDVSTLALAASLFLLLGLARLASLAADRRWALRERARQALTTARLLVGAARAIATGRCDHTNPLLLGLAETVWRARELETTRRALFWNPQGETSKRTP